MEFTWKQYCDEHAALLDSWLDEEARRFTGCADGWLDYYEYWIHEDSVEPGKNFWVLLACHPEPQAVFILGKAPNGLFTISECFVDPACRGMGIGTAALRELLAESETIIGEAAGDVRAAIYPNNIASRHMFERAGFRLAAAHPDGDVLYYHYASPQPCFCGHDCARCVTRLAMLLDNDTLRQRAVEFYKTEVKQEVSPDMIRCCGGRRDGQFVLCRECPFAWCCREKGLLSCDDCPTGPCALLREYRERFVNRSHQI